MEHLNSTATSNFSATGPPPTASMDSSSLVSAILLSLCFLVGIPGNAVVIVLRPNRQHLSSLSQILMLNLAVADLLCLLSLPLWVYALLYGWTLHLVACKLLSYLVYCCIWSSLLTVTALSVQRYLQVVYLHRCLDQRGKKRLLVLLWLLAMILSVPALVFRQLITEQHETRCDDHFPHFWQQVAVLMTESALGFISFCVVAFAYISLHRKVHQSAFFNNPQTTRLVTSITVTFFVLWMPYHVINIVSVAATSLKHKSLMKFCEDSGEVAGALVFVNACLNPLLYAFASSCPVCQKGKLNTDVHGGTQHRSDPRKATRHQF